MSEHKKVICSCGAVISNCRCTSPDKTVETFFEGCDLCRERNKAILDLFENYKISQRGISKLPSNRITSIETTPHCDARILHAPEECVYCDKRPEWQALRVIWGIAFTGYTPEGTELPCPADHARGDTHGRWYGNKAVKKLSDEGI